ncbi:hypothetical protein [Planctomyces sp. SH-PL62]|uniref:hypothetical protein n=1 Tax=Planctomyces sp. SH-PL62 TaxID=1636152 RepID=UPI00078BE47F|nr:hypothetical protein [Planctomyces sp. SH-PL62]AMV36953.1 hypothetical protein VT85_05945 [Planctomyces sp. SH-PL62]
MHAEEKLALLLETVCDDCQEWRDVFGLKCLRLFDDVGPTAVRAVAELMASTAENAAKLHGSFLLAHSHQPEAARALTDILDVRQDDEVLEQIFEDSTDSPTMRTHAPFIARARDLSQRWSNSSLDDFLRSLGAAAG